MPKWLAHLRWIYDGRPDPEPEDFIDFTVISGWGPIPLPGEKARWQRIRRQTKDLRKAMIEPFNPAPLAETLEPETEKIKDSITTLAGSAIADQREDVIEQLKQIGIEVRVLKEMVNGRA